jgi:predicted metal-dependent HD superfamily phosphohydrolase
MSDAAALLARFTALCSRMGLHGDVESAFGEIPEMYNSPPRAYHNLDHIEHCLRELDAARKVADRADEVEFALWLHDCVYYPTRHDNEFASAEVAENMLRALDAAESTITRVLQLISDTAHEVEPETADGELITDIDLSILGSNPADFDRYESAIRAEYAHLSDPVVAAGRRGVLEQFLARPRIYRTQWLWSRYETAARENLARSITSLRRIRMEIPPTQD